VPATGCVPGFQIFDDLSERQLNRGVAELGGLRHRYADFFDQVSLHLRRTTGTVQESYCSRIWAWVRLVKPEIVL